MLSRLHGAYWLLPAFAVAFWSATLLGLLLIWIVKDGHRAYKVSEYTVVFISDVGAAHQALFIPGTALTFIFYSLSLLCERWLRHLRRIPGGLGRNREKVADIIAIVFGMIGGLALLLLSIFNAFQYGRVHWTLTAVFVVCVSISALFQTQEVRWLEKEHPDRKHLRRNAIWKLTIVSVALSGAIVFGATYGTCAGKKVDTLPPSARCNSIGSVAGAFEWFIAALFDVYLFTFILDLWPATKTEGHHFDPSLVEADRANELHEHTDGRPGAPGGLTTEKGMEKERTTEERRLNDSQGTLSEDQKGRMGDSKVVRGSQQV